MKITTVVVILLNNFCVNSGIECSGYFCCSGETGVRINAKLCSDKWCYQSKEEDTDDRLLEVKYAKINRNYPINEIRKCSFTNLTNMVIIDGANASIIDIEPSAFWDMPLIEKISLPFNLLTTLKNEVFSYINPSSYVSVDLSWNKIYRIDVDAFRGLKLWSLNLSRNELSYFVINEDFAHIRELILSHNIIHDLEYRNFPFTFPVTLKVLDLSFNKLQVHPEILCFVQQATRVPDSGCTLDRFDLSHNLLTSFPQSRYQFEINIANISFNNFTEPGGFSNLLSISIKSLALYPNPWICSLLEKLLNDLNKRNIKILNHQENLPVCITSLERAYPNYKHRIDAHTKVPNCASDVDCSSDTICRAKKCYNPCEYSPCHTASEICTTTHHKFSCACPRGKIRNPENFVSRCFHVECFTDGDCEKSLKCKEHVCL